MYEMDRLLLERRNDPDNVPATDGTGPDNNAESPEDVETIETGQTNFAKRDKK